MRMTRPFGLAAMLGALLLLLAACSTGDETTSDTASNDTTAASGTERVRQTATLSANTPASTANTNAENDEASAPEVTLVAEDPGENPEAPWGKEIPTGPAPTVPPNPRSDFDSDGDGMYTIEELEEAIRYRYSEYEWPQNYVLDLDRALENMSFPEGSRHEAPGEYTFLGVYHRCAWELTLIDASLQGDQEMIDESMYQLVEFGQNKNPLSRDENGKAFMRDMYDRAVLGDVAPLQEWVNNNCETRAPNLIPESGAAPSPQGTDPDTDAPAANVIA